MGLDVNEYYRRYGPMVLRRCRRLLQNEEQAVDAMQDTFVKLLQNQGRLTHDAPSSLLFRIATNTCLNRIRTNTRRRENSLGDDVLQHIADCSGTDARIEARSVIDRLFLREKESTGAIAVMHLVDGMTLEQVAEQVGMSVSGVRKRLRSLREKLEKIEGVKR